MTSIQTKLQARNPGYVDDSELETSTAGVNNNRKTNVWALRCGSQDAIGVNLRSSYPVVSGPENDQFTETRVHTLRASIDIVSQECWSTYDVR